MTVADKPALVGGNVGDVTAPAGVQAAWVGSEVPDDRVGPDSGPRVGDRRQLPSPAVLALQSGSAHQPGDAAAPAVLALPLKDGVDARDPVGPARPIVDLGDLLGQLGVADRSRAGLAGAAGVEGGSGDLQQFTRALDVVTVSLLRLGENGCTVTGSPSRRKRWPA